MTIRILVIGTRTVTVERVGLLYRYTVQDRQRLLRIGCAFTMWGVRFAARHA